MRLHSEFLIRKQNMKFHAFEFFSQYDFTDLIKNISFFNKVAGIPRGFKVGSPITRNRSRSEDEEKNRSIFKYVTMAISKSIPQVDQMKRNDKNFLAITWERSRFSTSQFFSVVFKVRGRNYLNKQIVTFRPGWLRFWKDHAWFWNSDAIFRKE